MHLNHEEIRKNIETEIEKTKVKIEGYREMSQTLGPDNAIGRLSRMDAIVNGSVAAAALREAEQKLTNLKAMLDKVGHEDFGLCSQCKQPIPLRRLMLMPQSSKCVNCAR